MLEVPGEWKQLKGHLNRGFAAGREEGYKPMTASSLVPGFMPFDHGEEVKNFNGFCSGISGKEGVETVVKGVVATLWETEYV